MIPIHIQQYIEENIEVIEPKFSQIKIFVNKLKLQKYSLDFIVNPKSKELVQKYCDYRLTVLKKPFKSQRGVEAFYAKLKKLSNSSHELAEKILNQSMDKEWIDIFELKEEFKTNYNPSFKNKAFEDGINPKFNGYGTIAD